MTDQDMVPRAQAAQEMRDLDEGWRRVNDETATKLASTRAQLSAALRRAAAAENGHAELAAKIPELEAQIEDLSARLEEGPAAPPRASAKAKTDKEPANGKATH